MSEVSSEGTYFLLNIKIILIDNSLNGIASAAVDDLNLKANLWQDKNVNDKIYFRLTL